MGWDRSKYRQPPGGRTGRPRWRHCIAELEVLREVLSEDTEVPVGNVGEVLGGALVEGAADDHSFHLFVCILYNVIKFRPNKVCFARMRMNQFLSTPCSGPARPGGTCISCGSILVSKNSGYLLNKYLKSALRQCPKSFNTTVQMWTAAPPPPPSCQPESQHQAKIIK